MISDDVYMEIVFKYISVDFEKWRQHFSFKMDEYEEWYFNDSGK